MKIRTLSLGLLATITVSSSVFAAEGIRPQGTAPQSTLPQGEESSLNMVPSGAPLETLGYEQARQMLKVQGQVTPAQARANMADLAGSIVEMQGDVSGMMTTPKGRVFLLKIDGVLTTFALSPKFMQHELLKAGSKARVLVEVGDDAGFTILAATPKLLSNAAVVVAALAEPKTALVNSGITVPGNPTDSVIISADNGPSNSGFSSPLNDVLIVPPMTTMRMPDGKAVRPSTAPAPKVFRPGSPVTPERGTSLSSRGSDMRSPAARLSNKALPSTASVRDNRLDTLIDQQKPAYKQLARRHNARLTEQQLEEIATSLLTEGIRYNLDPRFLAAIISVESDFNIYSRSSSGAMGLGQLMPFNVTEAGIKDPWSPSQNIYGTAKQLRQHLDTFSRFGTRGPLLAVAAYNAGPNAVKRAGNNVPSGAQVQRYVWKVYNRYKEFAPDMFK